MPSRLPTVRSFGLGRRGLPLLAVGFAILLALGAAIFWLVEENREYAARTTRALRQRVATSQTLSTLQGAETGQRGFLLTNDAAYLDPYRIAELALPGLLAQLRELIGGAEVEALEIAIADKMAELQRTIELAQSGAGPQALAVVRTDEGLGLMNTARALVAALDEREEGTLRQAQARLEESGRLLRSGAIAAIGSVLLVAIAGLGLARRHAAELEAANQAIHAANDALEARVAERTAELAEANEEVQRFATVVTHDLRAPLVNVMGFAAELEASLPPLRALLEAAERADPAAVDPAARVALDVEIPEALGFIRGGTGRMDRLINTILKLSREGRRALMPEPIDTQTLVEEVVASLSHQAGAAGATIVVEPGLPALVSDRIAVEQVFGNLLDNAVKYLDARRPGRIVVRGRDRGRFLVYEISDNGRGIAARDLVRIFEPFRRAGAQDSPGEGIGLAHVRAMARRLGGVVTCESTPGEGSTFRVTLPPRLVLTEERSTPRHADAALERAA